MGYGGGNALVAIIEQNRSEVTEYYGSINEFKMKARGQPLPKPEILVAYEIVSNSNIPLLAGGLMDQPYIFSLQYEVVRNEVVLQKFLAEVAEPKT